MLMPQISECPPQPWLVFFPVAMSGGGILQLESSY